jgi:hypothetical protein
MKETMNITLSKQKLIVYIVLTVLTIAVYGQVSHFDFVNLDDNMMVYENVHIQKGFTAEGLRWAFTTNHADLWSPLIWLSLMLDYRFYGLNAGGYHITNLIWHLLSALLLFGFLNRATKTLWPSAFAAAVFALHPLHVESVAWVTERKDVLSAFFWMLTLFLYVRYTEKPSAGKYLVVLLSFFCGLISKPMIVTLPVIMILLDYWPLNRFETKKENMILWQVKEKASFFILSAVFSAVTFYVQYYVPSTKDYTAQTPIPLDLRLSNAAVSFVTYLEKTFWPHGMGFFYPLPASIPAWQAFGALLLILAVTVFVLAAIKRAPYLFVGWTWFVIAILPVIKILQIGNDAMADRYHYLPSIGLSVMVAWGVSALFKSESARKYILFPSALAAVALLAALSWHQLGYWKNSITLFGHTAQVTEGNYLAYSRMGNAYGREGNFQKAIACFDEVIRIRPDYVIAYNGRGLCYNALGMHERAIEELNQAVRLNPKYAPAYVNRAISYFVLGDAVSGCLDAQRACELGNCMSLQQAQANGFCINAK